MLYEVHGSNEAEAIHRAKWIMGNPKIIEAMSKSKMKKIPDPVIGQTYFLEDVIYISHALGYLEVLQQFINNEGELLSHFNFDGCSCYRSAVNGITILPYCRRHYFSYYIGGTRGDKARSDLILSLNVINATGSEDETFKVLYAVRFLGDLQTSFGWGFGQI